jgi:hypothetical protein
MEAVFGIEAAEMALFLLMYHNRSCQKISTWLSRTIRTDNKPAQDLIQRRTFVIEPSIYKLLILLLA